MWRITEDKLHEKDPEIFEKSSVGVCSHNYDGRKLEYRFRMKDDDDEIYYYGEANSCDDDKAFNPLDDFGMPDSGCTSIEYYNETTKEWEIL